MNINQAHRRLLLACFAFFTTTIAEAKVKVVATLPDLAAIVRDLGQDLVEVQCLASPKQDPHYVDARPSFLLPLSHADLLIVQGLGLEEGWLPPLHNNSRNPAIQIGSFGYLDASGFIETLQSPTIRIDRSQGDIHPGGNPHFSFDPRRVLLIIRSITDRMLQIDPKNRAQWEKQHARYREELNTLIESERQRFLQLPKDKRRVVVYHNSLIYLWDWLAIEEMATLEPKPGIPPSPGHVASVLNQMRATQTHLIAQEEFYPTRTAITLAELAKAQLIVIPGGARFDEGESYLARIRRTTEALYVAMAQ